jgi:dTDP-4-amino-4,6-dideoxygalactose transaminase
MTLKTIKNKRVFVGDFQIGEDEKNAVMEVLNQGRLSEGKKVREFERLFAEYVGTRYAIALSSGTSALIVGLMALLNSERFHVKKGSKVITSPVTYIATTNAIFLTGFEPVFVDIDPQTFAILPEQIETLLRTAKDPSEYSIILPVHLMGYPCNMDEINRIAKEYNLITFEDSAQAHGTIYNGKRTGSISLLSDFSFYIAHNIQAGEMGAVTTNDGEIVNLIRKLKANGRVCDCPVCTRAQGVCPPADKYTGEDDFDPRFTHDMIGYNFKTMEIQAALGITQLHKADIIFKQRQSNVKYLNEKLNKYSELLQLPIYSKDISYMAYPIVIRDPSVINRKELRKRLEDCGVENRPLFGCIPTQQTAYSFLSEEYKDRLPNAEYAGKNGFYIGCHQYLTRDDLDYIVDTFERILD